MGGDSGVREPWVGLEDESARRLEEEANLEIASGHSLKGMALRAIAKCSGCDDVVFRAPDDTFAIVHLTWSGHRESPPWPLASHLAGYVTVEAIMDEHGH